MILYKNEKKIVFSKHEKTRVIWKKILFEGTVFLEK